MSRALAVSLHFPADGQAVHGVYQRLDVAMRALAATFDDVDFLCLDTPHRPVSPGLLADWSQALRSRWGDNVTLQHCPVQRTEGHGGRKRFIQGIFDYSRILPLAKVMQPAVVAALQEALAVGPDLVFAHRLSAMAALGPLTADVVQVPVVFDLDDLEYVSFVRRTLLSQDQREKWRLLHFGSLLACERRAIRRAAVTLVCSEEDRRRLQRWPVRAGNVEVLRNSVSIPSGWPAPSPPATPTVTFVGTFDYKPNADAALTLLHEVFPRVAAQVPGVRLRLVGARPDRVPRSTAASAAVTFTGFVPDLAAEYAQTSVVCCPIKSGSGTRIKILEAAAYGLPVVSTRLGAEGLEFKPGHEIALADTPEELAAECVQLLRDPGRARRMGLAARAQVGALYDRAAAEAGLRALFERERNR